MKTSKTAPATGWPKAVEPSPWVVPKPVRFAPREGADEVTVDPKPDGKYSLINWTVSYHCNWYYMASTYKIVSLMIYWNTIAVCLTKNEI